MPNDKANAKRTMGLLAAEQWDRIVAECCSPRVRQSTYIPPAAAARLSDRILDILTVDRRGTRQKGA